MSTRSVGNKGEDLAVKFLGGQGYKIIDRNFNIRGGEIDIVARKQEFLVFVEVKARFSHEYGLPEESITYFKIKSLKKTALFYINKNRLGDVLYRFDLVAIDYAEDNLNPKIKIIENII